MSVFTTKHILASDDSPEIRALLRDLLEEEGYRVSLCAEPLSLDEIKRLQPDLVILDHLFAEGTQSNWPLMALLRQDPETASLPIVACTGAVERIRAAEADLQDLDVEVVLKPFDIDDLLRQIRERLGAQAGVVGCPTSASSVPAIKR